MYYVNNILENNNVILIDLVNRLDILYYYIMG